MEEGVRHGKPVVVLVTPAKEPFLPLLVVFRAGLLKGAEAYEDLLDELTVGVCGLSRPQHRRLVPGLLAVHAIEVVVHRKAIPPVKVIGEGARWSDSGVTDVKSLDPSLGIFLKLDVDLHGL